MSDLDGEIRSVARLLDLHAEETRTRLDLLTEKVVNGMTVIVDRLATIALDVGQLMNERVDNRRRIAASEARLDTHETQMAELAGRVAKLEDNAAARMPVARTVQRRKPAKKRK